MAQSVVSPRGPRARAILILVPLLALAAGTFWVTHPRSFGSPDEGIVMSGDIPVDEPLHIGMTLGTYDRDADIALRRAEAHVVEDSAGSAITFQVCTYATKSDGAIASATGDLGDYCSNLEPVDGSTFRMRTSGRPQEIIMTITPSRPGRIEIEGWS